MKTLTKTVPVTVKKTGEIWLNNKTVGKCSDCEETKPLFYSFVLPSGKVLTCSCEECFEKNNYFNVA